MESEAYLLTSRLNVVLTVALWLGMGESWGGDVVVRTTEKPAIVVFLGEALSVTSTVNG